MHSLSILSTLALVGSAFAAPIAEPEVVKVVVTATSIVVVTEGAAKPTQPAAPAAPVDQKVGVQNYGNQRPNKPSKPSVVIVTEVYNAIQPTKPATTYAPAPPKSTQAPPPPASPKTTQAPPAPKPSSTYVAVKPSSAAPQPSSAPSTGGSTGTYMDVVKTWRAKMGLPELKHDEQLEANARKTCTDGNGSMVHQLNKGTMGQVLAPGKANDFEHVFVGGWLCEVPSTKGLDGICATASKGWNYQGQTGHNEILVDPKKTKIGCAIVKGIWGCDLA